MEAAASEAGYAVVRISAERGSFSDFVEALAAALSEVNSALRQEIERWRLTVKIGPLAAERGAAPTRSLDELVQSAVTAGDQPLVLIIDEVPVLAKSMESDRPGSGGELLHLLRRLRQDHSGRLPMVLSGSIGFHHVTTDALGAVNDVERIPVQPLRQDAAVYLARCLLRGEQVPVTDEMAVADAIAAAAECVPYYVQQLVKSARNAAAAGRRVTAADVPGFVDAALTDPDDPWDLKHYRDRLPSYYGPQADLAAAMLDAYAPADRALSVEETLRHVGTAELGERPSRSVVISLLERLEADHYLVREGAGDRFASELVRRAWLTFRRR